MTQADWRHISDDLVRVCVRFSTHSMSILAINPGSLNTFIKLGNFLMSINCDKLYLHISCIWTLNSEKGFRIKQKITTLVCVWARSSSLCGFLFWAIACSQTTFCYNTFKRFFFRNCKETYQMKSEKNWSVIVKITFLRLR